MYGRKVRRGDKVQLRAARGEATQPDKRTWIVVGFEGKGEARQAFLVERADTQEPDTEKRLVSELVVVADFREPIYPGLRSSGKVDRGGDKPFQLLINGENFHVLEALSFAHRGAVDCIYIDPPYNSGARDWKYNNDYVDADDAYRHSKWLAMMERRLLAAKELLNPKDSVLIVTIDEKEYLRLGLLLEQTFAEARMQMVSVQVNPAAVARSGYFGRADEYYFFVMFGEAGVPPTPLDGDWITTKGRTHRGRIRWDLLRKSGSSPSRDGHPGTFYPLFAASDGSKLRRIGEPIGEGAARETVKGGDGEMVLWPIRDDGREGRWAVGPDVARELLAAGYLKLGNPKGERTPVYYLAKGERQKIVSGVYGVLGRAPDGSVVTSDLDSADRVIVPGSQWRIRSHDSTQYGSRLLQAFLPGRKFPFPKSLYAVEDALRFFVRDKPHALILDFFAGSGTTAHAVMRLNREDGGKRRCISVTNNEVSAQEATALAKAGHRAGDLEWEALGICEYITKPRLTAAVTGENVDGEPIAGAYTFGDEYPMADGFAETVEFFDLTYEDAERVRHGLGFEAIASLLWLRAGGRGSRIEAATEAFAIADAYAVLFNLDTAAAFVAAVREQADLAAAFIVTDDEAQFQIIARQLPPRLDSIRLYSAYLDNAKIAVRD